MLGHCCCKDNEKENKSLHVDMLLLCEVNLINLKLIFREETHTRHTRKPLRLKHQLVLILHTHLLHL